MCSVKHREAQQLAEGHTAGRRESQDLDLALELVFYTSTLIFSLWITHFCMFVYCCGISSNDEVFMAEVMTSYPNDPFWRGTQCTSRLHPHQKLCISWGPAFWAAPRAAEQEAGYGLVLPGRAYSSSETEQQWSGPRESLVPLAAVLGFDLVLGCLIGHQLQPS